MSFISPQKGLPFPWTRLALHDFRIRKLGLDTDWALRETSMEIENAGGLRNTGAVFSEAS